MKTSVATALAVIAVAFTFTGAVSGAQAADQSGTHVMRFHPYKGAPYAVRHKDADCPTKRGWIRK